jgi:hypothetical protein
MNKMKLFYKIYLAFGLLILSEGQSQNFDYSFSASTTGYADLDSPTYLAQDGVWNNSYYKIPIGFSFNYLGQTFDSVSIFNNGYLVFDNNFNYGFAAFTLNLADQKDSLDNSLSSISYNLDGSPGSRILKIQFGNCGISGEAAGYLNFQVWLSEGDKKISVLAGGNTFDPDVFLNYSKIVGLVNMNKLENGQAALLLSGDASSPSTTVINLQDSRVNITGFPLGNTLYTFTPNF